MDIALDKVCEFIIRAKAIDVKEGVTDPDSGSNPIDDGNLDSLMGEPQDDWRRGDGMANRSAGSYVRRFD